MGDVYNVKLSLDVVLTLGAPGRFEAEAEGRRLIEEAVRSAQGDGRQIDVTIRRSAAKKAKPRAPVVEQRPLTGPAGGGMVDEANLPF